MIFKYNQNYLFNARENKRFDSLLRDAVSAIDARDEEMLKHLLSEYPDLATKHLHSPGKW